MIIVLFGLYGLFLSFIFCYSLVQLHLVWTYWKNKRLPSANEEVSSHSESDLPCVTVQLPLYNELYVVERLIDSVAAFDYPLEKLEIQILDDSNDSTTAIVQEKVAFYQAKGIDITLIRRPHRTGYKAGALKYGLGICKGEYVAIFDADFLPRPDFLKRTIPHFLGDEKVGVVQTRWEHINKNYSMLTRIQAFGLDAHFTVEQVGRNANKHFINFNGTGGVWRKTCILDAGNWQSDTLTEDLDLSYRAQLKGWKFRYLEHIGAPAELPATMSALKSQQFRWTKGAAENAVKNLKHVLQKKLPISTKIHGAFHLLNSAVFLSVFISALLSIPVLMFKNEVYSTEVIFKVASVFLLSLGTLALFYATSYFQFERPSIKSFFNFIIMFPLFLSLMMGMSLHNAIAVIEGYVGKKTPFIRTPKFNIKEKKDTWKDNSYRLKNIGFATWLEGLLGLYFLSGIVIGVQNHDYGLLVYHVMLAFGFFAIFGLSLKHAFNYKT